MHPDDTQAGHLLASTLIKQATETKGEQEILQIAALSGKELEDGHTTNAAGEKQYNFELKAKHARSAAVMEIIFCGRSFEKAHGESKFLIREYPQLNIIWSASDAMSLAAITATEEVSMTPNQDIFTSAGIDWTSEVLQAIADGKMTASVGGHFMEGGWSLVLLRDYHDGIDFKDELGVQFSSQMQLITHDNVGAYLKKFGTQEWKQIDFRRFSKSYNAALQKYDF